MINIIWIFFIIFGIIYSLITGNISNVNNEIISSGKLSLDIFLEILPSILIWSGIMKIANNSGLINVLSKKLSPLLLKIFDDIPENHESIAYISSNVIANILGLSNASTPFGLKAMKSLQELNTNKTSASKSMIIFALLNICSLTILPTTIISLRNMYNSVNPSKVILPIFITSSITTICTLIISKVMK